MILLSKRPSFGRWPLICMENGEKILKFNDLEEIREKRPIKKTLQILKEASGMIVGK